MNHWLLEHDDDGEVYTKPSTDEPLIEVVLRLFDGVSTFYCCLSDTTDESCLWCVGEPDKRIIEGRICRGNRLFHFVLRRKFGDNVGTVVVKCGLEPQECAAVLPSETLTTEEAIAVFKAFYQGKRIPGEFVAVEKAYLFGSLSKRA